MSVVRHFIEISIVSIVSIVYVSIWIFAFAYFAMLFWNMFCSYAHLPEIGYWQMWGFMMFLSMIASVFKNKVTREE